MVTPKSVVETTPHVVAQIKRRERAQAFLRAGGRAAAPGARTMIADPSSTPARGLDPARRDPIDVQNPF